MQPATHKGFAERCAAEGAGLGPFNQHPILPQWIFHVCVFLFLLVTLCCFLSFVLPVGISAWQKCCCSFIWPFVKGKDKSC